MTAVVRELAGGLRVCRTGPEHAAGLEELQRIVFPTLADDQRFKAEHYRHHVEMFPEGQFCVLDGARVVGMTSTVRLDLAGVAEHSFADVIQGGWLTSHRPDGRWMYGADVGTHPDHRGRGIARALYAARHEAVRALGLDGQVTVGMPSGYGALADRMTADAYYAEVVSGARRDPTVSMQMGIGFEPRGLLAGYIDDPVCGGYGVLLVLPAERDVPWPG
jgi:GNAT superfamily N-acetyltransferase